MKHKMWSRLLSMALAVMMIASIVPNSAFAEAASEIAASSQATSEVQVEEVSLPEDTTTEEPAAETPAEEPAAETPAEEPAGEPAPTAGPVAEPTAEPAIESEQPTAEPTQAPAETAVPSEQPSAEPTEAPEGTETPEGTAVPTETPAPSESPVPSETPAPTETPEATEEPVAMNEEAYETTANVENADITVTVKVPEGALPVDAKLQADLIGEETEEYAEAEAALADEALNEQPVEYDGLIALDIRFEVNGEEVEPLQTVEVTIDAKAMLPEDADPETIAVQHVKENADGTATVEDMEIQKRSDTVAEFKVESFSVFLMSWKQKSQFLQNVDVTIEDQIKANGNIAVKISGVSDEEQNEFVYQWYRRPAGEEAEWQLVERQVVSGNSYNYTGSVLNVALDHELAAEDQESVRYEYQAKVSLEDKEWISNSFEVPYYTAIQNGGFEISDPVNSGFVWKTTALKQEFEIGQYDFPIEIYGTTNDRPTKNSGDHFAELNAQEVSSLYQDVLTVPGTTLNWQVAHRARNGNGDNTVYESATDTMYVVIMSTTDAEKMLNGVQDQQSVIDRMVGTILQGDDEYKENVEYVLRNGETVSITIKKITTTSKLSPNGAGSWESKGQWNISRDNTYQVPPGQYATRFFFVAGQTATGLSTVGNLIDDVWFSTRLPDPAPEKGSLQVQKQVYGISSSDIEDYQVTVRITNVATKESIEKTISSFNRQKDGAYKGTVNFQNIETGQYYVSESEQIVPTDSYILVENESVTTASVEIEDGKTQTAVLKNVYQGYGTIKVVKTFTGLTAEQVKSLEGQLTFVFTNTEDASVVYELELHQMKSSNDNSTGLTYEGQIENVKAGIYTGLEEGADIDSAMYMLATSGLDEPLCVEAGKDLVCSVSNVYTPKEGSLQIVKTVDQFGDPAVFLFEITGLEGQGTYYAYVSLAASDAVEGKPGNSVTIDHLPTGRYRITEILCPKDYELGQTSAQEVMINGGGTSTINFQNRISADNDSMRDSGSAVNRFMFDGTGWNWVKQ